MFEVSGKVLVNFFSWGGRGQLRKDSQDSQIQVCSKESSRGLIGDSVVRELSAERYCINRFFVLDVALKPSSLNRGENAPAVTG